MNYFSNTWAFLNNNLISSIIGGIVAGSIVGIILYIWTGRKNQHNRLLQIQKILKNDIDLNLKEISNIEEFIKTNHLEEYSVVNSPLKLASIELATGESYIQIMEPDMAILVSTLKESGKQFNEDYNYIKSSFGSTGNKARLAEIKGQFPDLLNLVNAAMTSLKGEL